MNAGMSLRCTWTGFPTVCVLTELCVTGRSCPGVHGRISGCTEVYQADLIATQPLFRMYVTENSEGFLGRLDKILFPLLIYKDFYTFVSFFFLFDRSHYIFPDMTSGGAANKMSVCRSCM